MSRTDLDADAVTGLPDESPAGFSAELPEEFPAEHSVSSTCGADGEKESAGHGPIGANAVPSSSGEADEVTGASPGTAQACTDLGLNSLEANIMRLGIKPPGVS